MTNDSNLNTTSLQVGVGSLDDKQLFSFVEYRADAAEETAYSSTRIGNPCGRTFEEKNGSVYERVFILLFLFTFIAGPIGITGTARSGLTNPRFLSIRMVNTGLAQIIWDVTTGVRFGMQLRSRSNYQF